MIQSAELRIKLGDANNNKKPDMIMELRIGPVVLSSGPVDGPGVSDVVEFFKNLAGMAGK